MPQVAERNEETVVRVRKVGGSKGLTLPKAIPTEVGDKYSLHVEEDGTIILKPKSNNIIVVEDVFANLDYSAFSVLKEEIVGNVGMEAID